MKVSELLNNMDYSGKIHPDINIENIAYDSRKVDEGSCFVAIRGDSFDGHDFIEKVSKKGAKLIIVDDNNFISKESQIIKVENSRTALSALSANFFKNPSKSINMIGITGTNGKTSVNQIVKNILDALDNNCASLGTLGFILNNEIINTGFTTPESLELHGMLKLMKDSNISYAVLEVSSHSLMQYRVEDIDFNVAIFTNLTQDHLDYHKTMENYFEAKSMLFSKLNKNSCSILNIDDSYGKIIYDRVDSDKISYGFDDKADICIKKTNLYFDKTEISINIFNKNFDLTTNLIGDYNVLNIAASIGALIPFGYTPIEIIDKINNINFLIPGRMELIAQEKNQYIYIDYAHTPDAYEKIFTTVKRINKDYEIVSLFGCGGDRDKDKRPIMANIAEKYCDKIFVTSDNPRNESLETITSDIVNGFNLNKHKIIEDRKLAIKCAIDEMGENSILFVLGKGRENYQIINNDKIFFSDVDTIKNYIHAN